MRADQAVSEQSGALYRELVEEVSDWVWAVDLEGRYFYSSPVVERILGYKAEEVIGKTAFEFIIPTEREHARQMFQTAVRERTEIIAFLNANRRKDGAICYLETSGKPILDERGNPTGYRGMDRDVTERVLAQRALIEGEVRFRKRYEAITAGVMVLGTDGVIKYANKAAAEILGVDLETLPGKHVADHFREVAPIREDGTPFSMDGLPALVTLRTGKPCRNVVIGILNPKLKTRIWMLRNTEPLFNSATGEIEEVVATFLDITERKRAEEALQEAEAKYRSLVEQSLFGVYILQEGKIVYVNPRAAEMLGYEPGEMMGKNILDFTAPVSHDLVAEKIGERLSGKVSSSHYITQAIHKDGHIVDLEVLGSITTYEGKPAIIGSSLDVTERKRSEEEILRRRERERQIELDAEESKRQFYRGTIMSVTDGKLVLLNYEEIQSLLLQDTQDIPITGPEMIHWLRATVMEFSKKTGMIDERAFELASAVDEAATNALKHGGGGTVRIDVKGSCVQVCVQDRGQGIDSIVLPKATLMKGFSTKPSMGLGYSIILAMADTVYLATGTRGTWVLLEKTIQEPEETKAPLEEWLETL